MALLACSTRLAPSWVSALIASRPWRTSVPPLWLLAAVSVNTPWPSLTRPPLPLMRPSNRLLAPLPPVVKLAVPSARLPALAGPALAAPPASEPTVWLLCSASTTPAPSAKVTATRSVSAAMPARLSVPPSSRSVPSNRLAPARVKVPLPCLSRPPLWLITPSKRLLRLSAPLPSVKPPSSTCPPVAAPPASEPTRPSANSARLTSAALARVTALCASASACRSTSRPLLTVVAPSNRLGPAKVRLPLPCLVRPPLPLITPAKTVLRLSPPRVRPWLASATAPPLGPPPASEPITVGPSRLSRAPAASCKVTALLASAAGWSSTSVPAATRVAPVKVWAAARVKLPLPRLSSPPLPLITPP